MMILLFYSRQPRNTRKRKAPGKIPFRCCRAEPGLSLSETIYCQARKQEMPGLLQLLASPVITVYSADHISLASFFGELAGAFTLGVAVAAVCFECSVCVLETSSFDKSLKLDSCLCLCLSSIMRRSSS